MTDSPHPAAAPFPFTPVPGRARHDGWTPARQHRFVAALGDLGTVSAAARVVGMSAKSAYALRGRAGEDSGFVRAWDAALDRGYHDALDVAVRHAIDGERVPVFYGGRQVGEYRRHDTRLAMAALRAAASREGTRRSVPGPSDPTERFHWALDQLGSSTFPPIPRDL